MENLKQVWSKLDEGLNEIDKVYSILYGTGTILNSADEQGEDAEITSALDCLDMAQDRLKRALTDLRAEQNRISLIIHPERAA